jgi:hypothetical protein
LPFSASKYYKGDLFKQNYLSPEEDTFRCAIRQMLGRKRIGGWTGQLM